MPKLNTIVVGHTTANVDQANSTADFTLEIVKKSGRPIKKEFRKNLVKHSPQNDQEEEQENDQEEEQQEEQREREKRQLDLYRFDVSRDNVNSDDPGFRIRMRINSTDGWLPQSIFVLGHTETGGIVLLGYHPQWGSDTSQSPRETSKWFDKEGAAPIAGPEAHVISS